MLPLFLLSTLVLSAVRSEDSCDVSEYVACMAPIHNATFGHERGLFQNARDLEQSCPVIKDGFSCIENYAKRCGTDMIAENFQDQIERPGRFLKEICDRDSTIRRDYIKASECLREYSEDLEVCSTKVQEFLSVYDVDTVPKEVTVTCMYELMLRACLLSTTAEKCGLETADFVRRALKNAPSLGMKTCDQE